MFKRQFVSYVKKLNYKEPINIYKNIITIKNKNIDINDINYSKNLWENIKKYKKI